MSINHNKSILRITAASIAAILMAMIYNPITVSAAPSVSASNAVLINASTGEVLYEKNGDGRVSPSSCAKIVNGLVAVENGSFNQYVTMSYNSIWGFDRASSHIALDVDEVVTFEQLIYGMMLVSANDCAIGIAETVSGSTDAYTELMNEKAKEIGATETNFTNPCGTYDADQYTTARDMAIILKAAKENEKLLEIMSTLQYTIPPTNKQSENRVFNNSCKMLAGREYYYPSVICGKSGYDQSSGNSLVTYAESGGIELIVAIFGEATSQDAYSDTSNLLDYFFGNYEMRRFSAAEQLSGELEYIELACAGAVKCSCTETISVLFEKNAEIGNVICVVNPDDSLELPITEGQKIGYVSFSSDGRHLGDIPIYSAETLYVRSDAEIPDNISDEKEKGVSVINDSKTSAFGKFLIISGYILLVLVILFAVFIIIALCIRQQKIRKMQRRKMTRKRSGEYDRKRPFSDTPYGKK